MPLKVHGIENIIIISHEVCGGDDRVRVEKWHISTALPTGAWWPTQRGFQARSCIGCALHPCIHLRMRHATCARTRGISSRPYSRASCNGLKPRISSVVTPAS
jgi:hypothetical protein